MASDHIQPNPTLYLNNLNDKITIHELRLQLYALFTTYGNIRDIVAAKGPARRGQAFLVFTDLQSATAAMRACDGMIFYDKPLHIHYAKTKSHATSRAEDPFFVPPTAPNAKRPRDADPSDHDRSAKREKNDDSDEEMEIDDDDNEPQPKIAPLTTVPSQVQQPTQRLLCQNLPQEVTDDVLSVLFQQQVYKGFTQTHVSWSPQLNSAGIRVKMAQVHFESPELAKSAKDALDGFTLKKGWQMSVAYY